MLPVRRWLNDRSMALLLVAATALATAGCEGILDVDDPTVVQPEALNPQNARVIVNGVVLDFQEAFDDYTRYSAMFTDEMILAGTFPTRLQVDERRIDPDNSTITGELYEPLQTARHTAQTREEEFAAALDDPEFSEITDILQEGLLFSRYYGGYARLLLGELYCRTVLDSLGSAVSSDEAVQSALAHFERAEATAGDAGRPEFGSAALIGQARAHLWLGNYQQAADLVSGIPDDFILVSEYSSNTTEQYNELYTFTYGDTESIRWTVGDSTADERGNEKWAYLQEWVELGLIDPEPTGFSSFNSAIPVNLQRSQPRREADVPLASGWEARMIQAEAELRAGNTGAAEDIINPLLTDPEQANNPIRLANPSIIAAEGDILTGAFEAVSFTGDLQADLRELARARAAGLWLSGQRQATLRRFLDDGVNLYPDREGDDTCFPIVQQELDNNPNVDG